MLKFERKVEMSKNAMKKVSYEDIYCNMEPNKTPNYDDLVNAYKAFGKQAAEQIVGMAHTLLQAKIYLGEFSLKRFCDDVGLEMNGPTYRKLILIGSKYSRFSPLVEKLPNNWTTLYQLAKLEDDQFNQLTQNLKFGPFLTASELTEMLSPPSTKPKKSSANNAVIDFEGLGPNEVAQAYARLKQMEREFGLKLTFGADVVSVANSVPVAQTSSIQMQPTQH
jgi:hypothetical protein